MQNSSTHNNVTLVFPNMFILWKFAQTLKLNSIEINTLNKTLVSSCSENDINRAITNYNATLAEGANTSVYSSNFSSEVNK